MTNTQLYLAIGVPFFSLLVVFLLNNRSIDILRAEMREGFAGTNTRMDRIDIRLDHIERDQREFYAVQRQHDTRLEAIERKPLS